MTIKDGMRAVHTRWSVARRSRQDAKTRGEEFRTARNVPANRSALLLLLDVINDLDFPDNSALLHVPSDRVAALCKREHGNTLELMRKSLDSDIAPAIRLDLREVLRASQRQKCNDA
jgi:hypothetical protein